ncbi:MAG: hypothetical protein Q7T49_02135 [bacterium]|nr:hypothetical protein [bacterium]
MVRIKLHTSHNSLLGRPAVINHPARRESKSLLERLAFWFLIVVVFLGAIFWALANWPKLLLNEVVVEGAQIVKSEEIINTTNNFLAGQALPLIPRRHLWWYPAHDLATQLLSQFPRLVTVKTFAEWPGRLTVVVTEREPKLLYCALDKCAFIDTTGRAFAPAPTFSPGVFLTWEASSTLPVLPFNLAPAADITRLITTQKIFNKVLGLLKLNQLKINRLEHTVDNDFIFWVDRLGASAGTASTSAWQILINSETLPFDLGENLHTALSAIIGEGKSHPPAGGLPALNYLDLRFGQKVFYKL